MFTNATNKFRSLVMTGLADVDGINICIQVGVAVLPTPKTHTYHFGSCCFVYLLLYL